MPGLEAIRSLLQQSNMQGSRSTALNPLGWAFAIVISATVSVSLDHPPVWLTPSLAICSGIFALAYLIAYFFLLIKDRDALRSEKYQLSKLAIERSMVGDNITGFIESNERAYLPTPEAKGIGD